MDTLTATLDGHRARGVHVLHVEMEAPWSVAVQDEATVGVLVMVRGEAWLDRAGHDSVGLRPGDVVITTAGLEYTFAGSPGVPPTIVIGPGEVSRDLVGNDLCVELSHGVRRWGNAPGGEDAFLVGTYELASQVTGRLLDAVPGLVVVRGGDWDRGLIGLLVAELGRDLPGQDVVIDRLVDLVLVTALRRWFAEEPGRAPRWWTAQSDPVVGPVLSAMQADPAAPWTLTTLAREAAVSRATLARRFTDVVGESPMAYLARWRMDVAAQLLRDTDATVEQVSGRVGYASPFAFTAAFKRAHGMPPRTFRRKAG
ncbi:AraC family transcriptional regulator [Intrasporangium sp.]|jgi:AraC-like DNA-binding protein|uniref:AraC family transcriptional regulator n=1 Tax=Intrasporangium sp. TaxID=1925024 RepID=UPI0033656585